MEETTPFYEWWQAGELQLPTEDTEADMFQYTIDTLTTHGYTHYEICNFAKPNRFRAGTTSSTGTTSRASGSV